MAKFRKKPVIIEATQWFKNGDHPEDYKEDRPWTEGEGVIMKPGQFFKENQYEGGIVRYFRRPDLPGDKACDKCGQIMDDHGWIETLEGGHIVCPGDWIITGVQGEHYPCKPDIFEQTYISEEVEKFTKTEITDHSVELGAAARAEGIVK